jgi:thioesterase domain-containing protein
VSEPGTTGALDRSRIEAILPLAPMQEAVLFAMLGASAEGTDPGFLQLRCTLHGDLDETHFRHAWQYVTARHAALRTSVHWRETERPVQVVARDIDLPLTFVDLRDLPPDLQVARIDAFLEEDRSRGLDPGRAPAMRLAVLRLSNHESQFVWTCHHVLLDGWSGALVLGEVSQAYEALSCGEDVRLPPIRGYREFIAWLQQQDDADAERFWRAELAGMKEPTPLPFDSAPHAAARHVARHAAVEARLDAAATTELLAFARRHRLTTGTLIQGAWALVLSSHGRGDPPCFGATVSGRSAPIPGIESMTGVFNNTLPVRCTAPLDLGIVNFLQTLQEQLTAVQRHAHTSPARIHAWSGVPGARRLFESMVVFENFPADVLGARAGRRLLWRDLRGGITTGHAMALVAAPGDHLALTLLYDPNRFAAAAASRIVTALCGVLARLPAEPDARAAALVPVLPDTTAVHVPAAHADAGEAPDNRLELRLFKIWERVLGTRGFGVEDDFFELGGHSLLVARTLAEIEAQLEVRLPVSALFRAPTIRALALEVERSRTAIAGPVPASPMVVLLAPGEPGDTRPPLFFMHGLGGDVMVSYKLVRYLAAHQRVYGVQADRFAGHSPAGLRIEEMAATYAREIANLHPRGPCILAGYCFGGTLAYETARQLAASGREVGLLALIDSDPRIPRWPRNSRAMHAIWNLQMTPRGQRAAAMRRKLTTATRMVVGSVFSLRTAAGGGGTAAGNGDAPNPGRRIDPLHAMDDVHIAALKRFHPRTYEGRVTLFLARDDPPGLIRHRRTAWTALAKGGTAVVAVPGTHHTLMEEPLVRELADRFQTCLDASAAGA